MKLIKNRNVNERVGIIGSSQIASILGIEGAFNSEFEVWQQFVGQTESESSSNEAMLAGTCLEDGIAKMYEFKYNTKLKKLRTGNAWQHSKFEWAICHPDRIIDKHTALEIKLVSSYNISKWGEDDTDEIPMYYLTQVLWYMIVNEQINTVYVARFTNNQLHRYIVKREDNKDLIETILCKVLEWVVNVRENGYIPDRITSKDHYEYVNYIGLSNPLELESLDTNIKLVASKYKDACRDSKDAEIRKKEAIDEMVKIIGERKAIKYQNRNVVYYQTNTRVDIDTERLKKDHPDIFEQYKKIREITFLRINARDEDIILTESEKEKLEEN